MNVKRIGVSLIPSVASMIASIPWCATFYLLQDDGWNKTVGLFFPIGLWVYGLFCTFAELSEPTVTRSSIVSSVKLYENSSFSIALMSMLFAVLFDTNLIYRNGIPELFYVSSIMSVVFVFVVRIVVNVGFVIEDKKVKNRVKVDKVKVANDVKSVKVEGGNAINNSKV